MFTDGLSSLLELWPIWALLAVIVIAKFTFDLIERRRILASGINRIDKMTGVEFERYLAELFRQLGYSVSQTRITGDYGADLLLLKDGMKSVVQAKRYKKKLDQTPVREAVASKAYYNCQTAFVVTNSTFTRAAYELARVNGVSLWDRNRLISVILSIRRARRRH